jgi:hypothetical protein
MGIYTPVDAHAYRERERAAGLPVPLCLSVCLCATCHLSLSLSVCVYNNAYHGRIEGVLGQSAAGVAARKNTVRPACVTPARYTHQHAAPLSMLDCIGVGVSLSLSVYVPGALWSAGGLLSLTRTFILSLCMYTCVCVCGLSVSLSVCVCGLSVSLSLCVCVCGLSVSLSLCVCAHTWPVKVAAAADVIHAPAHSHEDGVLGGRAVIYTQLVQGKPAEHDRRTQTRHGGRRQGAH